MDWATYLATHRQAEYPDLNVVRFVRNQTRVALDIGCGAGANTKFLVREGYKVWALDKYCLDVADNPNVVFVEADICDYVLPSAFFDLILDFNTLCHVERPPWTTIHDALRQGGKFLTISPATDTWRGTLEGKGFVRVAYEQEVRASLSMFSNVHIDRAEYPDFHGHQIKSWVAECTK